MKLLLWALTTGCGSQWEALDLDGDGSAFGEDCDETNPNIGPNAVEDWYNGIDENCDGNDGDQDGDGQLECNDCLYAREVDPDYNGTPMSFSLTTNAGNDVRERVGQTIRRFHDVGLDHVDLNARNLLVGPQGEVFMIDLDRCRLRAPGRWQAGNLARLERSLEKFASAAALPAILAGYHGNTDV